MRLAPPGFCPVAALSAAVLLGSFAAAPSALAQEAQLPVRHTLPSGDQIHWDGSAYDFRAASGVEMIKLWVPPGARPVRGVLISGHGGGGGDSRQFARYDSLRAFAARLGFGLAGLHNFPGRRAYGDGAPLFFKALDAFAALGLHPELANVPFAMYGSSNGGSATYGFVNAAPRRALCFLMNVSAGFNPPEPVPDALEVPGIVDIGLYDPFGRGRDVAAATELIGKARARGARWSLILEQKGHEDGVSFDLYMKLVERALAARYPAELDPRRGPVALRSLPERTGWLIDLGSFASGLPRIASYADYTGDRSAAGWLIDQDLAQVFRAAAAHDSPVTIAISDVARVANPHVDPATMFSIGGPVLEPGRRLQVVADVADVAGWRRFELFEGARKLGEARAPGAPRVRITADGRKPVHVLTGLVHDADGRVHPAPPLHFFVRDPRLDLRGPAERTAPAPWATELPPGAGGGAAIEVPLRPDDAILVSHGLTPRQEVMFGARAGQPSAFWEELNADWVTLDPASAGAEGSRFSIVHTADIVVQIKAAHSRRGVYFHFKITDDRFRDAVPESYNLVDAVELLVDPQSSADLNAPAMAGRYLNPEWALGLRTRQYQVATGGRSFPTVMRRNLPDPWDMAYRTISLADARARHGIVVRHSKLGRMHRVQEWFIPWAELTGGVLQGEPAPGTRLALALSYNDTDDDGATKRLRWVDKKGPWGNAGDQGVAPRGWGDLLIGPVLGDAPAQRAAHN